MCIKLFTFFDLYFVYFLQYSDTVGWVFWPVKTVGRITYIVLAQTLNHAQLNLLFISSLHCVLTVLIYGHYLYEQWTVIYRSALFDSLCRYIVFICPFVFTRLFIAGCYLLHCHFCSDWVFRKQLVCYHLDVNCCISRNGYRVRELQLHNSRIGYRTLPSTQNALLQLSDDVTCLK